MIVDRLKSVTQAAVRHTLILTRVLWKTVVRVETGKIVPWIALRNTFGVVLPLALGVHYGQVPAGIVMGLGALNVSFSDGKDPYQQRARRMLLASFFCGVALAIGSVTGRDPIASTLVAACWAFGAGMMVAPSAPLRETSVR